MVVASGHYHACRIPDIVGLKAWRTSWPDRVHHSKFYRNPNEYKNQVRHIGFPCVACSSYMKIAIFSFGENNS